MKAFYELNDQELIDLTPEQVQRYCDFEAASNGVILPGPEPEVFVPETFECDSEYFECYGLNFRTREAAEDLQRLLQNIAGEVVKTDYDYRIGYDHKYLTTEDVDRYAIQRKTCFSLDKYNQLRASLEENATKKSEADRLRSDWTKNKNKYDAAVGWIFEKIADARELIHDQEINQKRFDEYLVIADNDAQQAWKFFEKAGLVMDSFRPVGAPPEIVCHGHEVEQWDVDVEDK